jgi:hypothetical protein
MSKSFDKVWQSAYQAGVAAAESASVKPMTVHSSSGQSWFVADGVCGFAWIKVKGNTAFGKWAKANGLMKPAYGGGLQYWVGEFGQSMQKKEVFADAVAEVLRSHGVDAYSDSRMD